MSEHSKHVPTGTAAHRTAGATTTDHDEPRPSQIAHDIEQTRAHMTETLTAIEQRLNPTELREKAVEELHVVEEKVREVVKEQFEEAKAKVKEELTEAKDHAKDEVKQAFHQAKQEVKEAFHEASQALRDATIGKVEHMARKANDTVVETSETVMDTIRANPIPAALTGLGLLWLFMNRTSRSSIQVRYRDDDRRGGPYRGEERGPYSGPGYPPQRYASQGYATMNPGYQGSYDARYAGGGQGYREGGDRRYDPRSEQGGLSDTLHRAQHSAGDALHRAQDAAGHAVHQAQDAAGQMAHDVRDKVSGMAHQVADTASHAAHQVADTASHAAHQAATMASQASAQVSHLAHEAVHRASQTVDHLGHDARVQARRLEDSARENFDANPLAVGAIAIAVGTVVGLSLPHTRREDELFGETRDRLIGRVEQVAQGALETAHQYTDQAVEQVRGALHESERARG